MRHIQLILEYDGTHYSGWQSQKNGIAIQDTVRRAIVQMTEEAVTLTGASRTDAGVHALGQVASFQTARRIGCDGFLKGLNCLLPPDIRIKKVSEVAETFDPIRHAQKKMYRYLVWNNPVASPLFQNRCWHVGRPLDLEAMREALGHFVGEHDFTGFRAVGSQTKTTVRTVYEIDCCQGVNNGVPSPLVGEGKGEGCHFITFSILGSGFLKYMVRNIVGTVVEVGQGKRKASSIPHLIQSKNRRLAGQTAPACGLYLVKVDYSAGGSSAGGSSAGGSSAGGSSAGGCCSPA